VAGERREVRCLRESATGSLAAGIGHFHQIRDEGRVEATLLLLDHALTTLLLAVIVDRGEGSRIWRGKKTIGLDEIARLIGREMQILSLGQILAFRALRWLRNSAQHYLLILSDGQFNLFVDLGVTLFGRVYKSEFGGDVKNIISPRATPTLPRSENWNEFFARDAAEISEGLRRSSHTSRFEATSKVRAMETFDVALRYGASPESDNKASGGISETRSIEDLCAALREAPAQWKDLFPQLYLISEIREDGEIVLRQPSQYLRIEGQRMRTQEVIRSAVRALESMKGESMNLLTISKPSSMGLAMKLPQILSKLSPLLGNLIEYSVVDILNARAEQSASGRWVRQDPGFPDAVFLGDVEPRPGIEVKTWFPLSTEMTARFRDSQKFFQHDQTHVLILAWLPERVVFGRPRILDVCSVSGRSVAERRDNHYCAPPEYLVIEPEDTSGRTRNLQQTNVTGHKLQREDEHLEEARKFLAAKGVLLERGYSLDAAYQAMLRDLMNRYDYRLDTNFAKIDRISHPAIEAFKARVLGTEFQGMTVGEWAKILSSRGDENDKRAALSGLGIKRSARSP